ncbi:hypothetical protein QR680_004119 [Steinernema hermaphroditum]|uniref:Uncharacterized protein n=1 Tax=Steinernema hermaphroditum TaxID=289476 RepID=A0AA39HMP4_9BILA|nr:hypothetical protein QR680_004119 [Steinernema hermaphroditum]
MGCCSEEKCCCGCVHVKTGTETIGILTVFFGGIGVAFAALAFYTGVSVPYYGLYVFGVACLCSTLLGSGLIIGALNNYHMLLIPYMIVVALELAVEIVSVALFTYMFWYPGKYVDEYMKMMPEFVNDGNAQDFYVKYSIPVCLASMTLACLLSVWFLTIVHNCYKYIKSVADEDPAESVLMLEKA